AQRIVPTLQLMAARAEVLMVSLRLLGGLLGDLQLGIEIRLAGAEPGDLTLQRGELAMRLLRALARRCGSRFEPADLLVGSRCAALHGIELPVQPRQTLTLVGRGPQQAGDAALLGGV